MAVIIPAYGARNFLPQCIQSLKSQEGVNLTLIVSDNLSEDGTVEYVGEHHPEVKLIENKANLGFSAAVNRGLNAAKDADYVALVNPDTAAQPGFLANMVRALEETPEAGIGASRMMILNQPDCIDCMGVAVTCAFGQLSIGGGRSTFQGFHERHFVPAACGGGMMIRRAVIDAIGGFDEDYFLCWEDLEYSFRAYRSGFKCLYVPDAVILHASTAIMGHWSVVNVFNYCRGALPTAVKLLPLRDLLLYLPLILLNRVKIAVLYAGGGRLGAALKGELSSMALAWRMFRKRWSLPRAKKGFPLRRLLGQGNHLRKMMKKEGPP